MDPNDKELRESDDPVASIKQSLGNAQDDLKDADKALSDELTDEYATIGGSAPAATNQQPVNDDSQSPATSQSPQITPMPAQDSQVPADPQNTPQNPNEETIYKSEE